MFIFITNRLITRFIFVCVIDTVFNDKSNSDEAADSQLSAEVRKEDDIIMKQTLFEHQWHHTALQSAMVELE